MKKFLSGIIMGILLTSSYNCSTSHVEKQDASIYKCEPQIKTVMVEVPVIKTLYKVVYKDRPVALDPAPEPMISSMDEPVLELPGSNDSSLADIKEDGFERYKNRISVLFGYGPKKLEQEDISVAQVSVEMKKDYIYGAYYQRSVSEKYSVGVGAMSNSTLMIGFGADF